MILKQVQVEKMCIKLRLCLRAEKPKLPNFFQAQSARSARQKLIKVQWRKIPDISNDLNSFQGGCHELHDLKQKFRNGNLESKTSMENESSNCAEEFHI